MKIPLPKRKLPPIGNKTNLDDIIRNNEQDKTITNNSNTINLVNQANFNNIDNNNNNQIGNRRRINNIEKEHNNKNNEISLEETAKLNRRNEIKRLIQIQKNNQREIDNVPEFIKNLKSEEALLSYLRMKNRHELEGALNITVEEEDVENENIELYDSKCINLESSKLPDDLNSKEFLNNPNNKVKYFIESLSRNKFYHINYDPDLIYNKKDNFNVSTNSINNELNSTENIYNEDNSVYYKNNDHKKMNLLLQKKTINEIKKDEELETLISNSILAISNNISIIFLFAQGVLAGLAVANIMFLNTFKNYKTFINVFSNSVEIYYNVFHFLIFGSIVGNGNKFLNILRYKQSINLRYKLDDNTKSIIKNKLIIIGVVFLLLLIAFILMLYIANYIPRIFYSNYASKIDELISEDEFNSFKIISVIIDIIVIINFMINIFGVSRVNDVSYDINKLIVSK